MHKHVVKHMKKILLSTIIGILFCSCSSSKQATKYFNENNIEISKPKFNKLRLNTKLLAVHNDSLNKTTLMSRETRGKLSNHESFYYLIEKELKLNIERTKPIVIIYYFNKDPYNSGGGFIDKQWIKNWKNKLEIGLNQIAGIKPIYLYKNFQGLKKHEGIIPWKKDPKNEIGQLFFKHEYPWLSFVVISKHGRYIGGFGEFPIEYIWKSTQIMNQ